MRKYKDIITIILLSAVCLTGAVASVATPDLLVSESERRKLAKLPRVQSQQILSGDFFTKLDEYLTDQFVPRDTLRTLVAASTLGLFRQLDYNGLYLYNGAIASVGDTIDKNSADGFIRKHRDVMNAYFPDSDRVFFSVIPDKNYYLSQQSGRYALDTKALADMVLSGLPEVKYIDLLNTLTSESYYRTDTHWSQDRLDGVVSALGEGLGREITVQTVARETFAPFFGVYHGQFALPVNPDSITYLRTPQTDTALVLHIEPGKSREVYDLGALNGPDPYDVFLSGATSVVTVYNTEDPGLGTLIIFRDSYTSSLAPLLLSGYSKIVLVDLRYIAPVLLSEFVDFSGSDILFLYSESMINKSGAIRGF